MPRRRRVDKRRAAVDAETFVLGDGTAAIFDGTTTYSSPFLARDAWRHARPAAWASPDRGIAPPLGATRWDGIGGRLLGTLRPPSSLVEVRRRHAEEVAALDSWRRANPAEARTVAAALEEYRADLDAVLAVAEVAADRGVPVRDALDAYETRRWTGPPPTDRAAAVAVAETITDREHGGADHEPEHEDEPGHRSGGADDGQESG